MQKYYLEDFVFIFKLNKFWLTYHCFAIEFYFYRSYVISIDFFGLYFKKQGIKHLNDICDRD